MHAKPTRPNQLARFRLNSGKTFKNSILGAQTTGNLSYWLDWSTLSRVQLNLSVHTETIGPNCCDQGQSCAYKEPVHLCLPRMKQQKTRASHNDHFCCRRRRSTVFVHSSDIFIVCTTSNRIKRSLNGNKLPLITQTDWLADD